MPEHLSILTLQANHPKQLCPARFSLARANHRVWPSPQGMDC